MKNKNFAAVAALAASLVALPAHAVDSMSAEIGSGKGVDMWRIGAQWKWQSKWFQGPNYHLGGYWDLQIGQWDGADTITDIGLTPTFRLQPNSNRGPYLEGAIGFHYLSSKNIAANRRFSTNFQFGDHVGAGLRFGDRGQYDLSVRFQHLSNASIKRPNPGINFGQLRFQYHF